MFEIVGEIIELLARQVACGYPAAIFQETATNAVADSSGGAGYERDLVAKGQDRIVFLGYV